MARGVTESVVAPRDAVSEVRPNDASHANARRRLTEASSALVRPSCVARKHASTRSGRSAGQALRSTAALRSRHPPQLLSFHPGASTHPMRATVHPILRRVTLSRGNSREPAYAPLIADNYGLIVSRGRTSCLILLRDSMQKSPNFVWKNSAMQRVS